MTVKIVPCLEWEMGNGSLTEVSKDEHSDKDHKQSMHILVNTRALLTRSFTVKSPEVHAYSTFTLFKM